MEAAPNAARPLTPELLPNHPSVRAILHRTVHRQRNLGLLTSWNGQFPLSHFRLSCGAAHGPASLNGRHSRSAQSVSPSRSTHPGRAQAIQSQALRSAC